MKLRGLLLVGCLLGLWGCSHTNDYKHLDPPPNPNDFTPLSPPVKRSQLIQLQAAQGATHTVNKYLAVPMPPNAPALAVSATLDLTNTLVFNGTSLPIAWTPTVGVTNYAVYVSTSREIQWPVVYSNFFALNLSNKVTRLTWAPTIAYFHIASTKGNVSLPLTNGLFDFELDRVIQWPPATNVVITVYSTNSNTILPLVLTNPPTTFFRLSVGPSAAMWQTSPDLLTWTNRGAGFPISGGIKLPRIGITKTNW